MERQTRGNEKDKKTRVSRKRTITGGSSEYTGSKTSSAASSRERSASNSSRFSTKSGSSSVKSSGKLGKCHMFSYLLFYFINPRCSIIHSLLKFLPENCIFLYIGSQVARPKSRKPGTKRIGVKFPDRERASSNSDCDSISQTSR